MHKRLKKSKSALKSRLSCWKRPDWLRSRRKRLRGKLRDSESSKRKRKQRRLRQRLRRRKQLKRPLF